MNFDDVAAFPLCWPSGWQRVLPVNRKASQFKIANEYEATQGLRREVEALGGRDLIVSTSIPLRRDGIPYSKPPVDGDPGVAIYFVRKKQRICFACDQYTLVKDNIHALTKTIEALRGIERWGSSGLLERAFTGFAALPSARSKPWHEVLGVSANASADQAQKAYRALARDRHPDTGGSDAEMSELNDAFAEAKKR